MKPGIFDRHRLAVIMSAAALLTACGGPAGPATSNADNSSANTNGISSKANTANIGAVESTEPGAYKATVTLKLEVVGGQSVSSPPLKARVSRNGDDRRMEFDIPAGGHVVYLTKGATNYLILPDKKQYAEIDKASTGFEIRRMMMPEQIVEAVKKEQAMERMGESKYEGRDAVMYRYAGTAHTQTAAGEVSTSSLLYVDQETGLPLHSETLSQASGNVKGFNGLKIVTDMTDVDTKVSPDLFELPSGLQKIEPEQVRAQVDIVFSAVATALQQLMSQGSEPAASPASPAGEASPAGSK